MPAAGPYLIMMLQTLTAKHPPLPLHELIEAVRAFPAMPLGGQKAFLSRLIKSHVTLSVAWGTGWAFRRTRKLAPGDLPGVVEELIWRHGVPAQLGRANPADFDVMYVSDRRETSLREARVDTSHFVMTEFAIQQDKSTRVAPIGEFTHVQRSGRGYLLGPTSDAVSGMLNACAHDEAAALLVTDAFLLQVFSNDPNYELSSHIAREIFDKDDGISAVAYPSQRHPGGINFAVRVETFWRDWALIGVRYGEARHLACGVYDIDGTQAVDGVYQNGRLRWCDVVKGGGIRLEPYAPV